MRRLVALACLISLTLVACTSDSVDTTSTTATTQPPVDVTSTTIPDPCPDVFCLVYTIRPDAAWSDGTPVTADDFAYTLSLFLDPEGPDPANPGYDLVAGFEVVDSETLLIAMSEDFAAWRTLFEVVYPSHVSYDPVMPGPTSGPFSLASWEDGEVVLQRNTGYTGRWENGEVETITFEAAPGVRDIVAGLRSGRFDVAHPTPLDWVVDEIGAMSGVDHSLTPGAFWEHITFNHSDPLLSQQWVREAIASALDREDILDATVRDLHPETPPLGNTIWMNGSIHYRDHFEVTTGVGRAEQLMTANGCSKGSDGIFVCGGERASFVWATTLGDPYRSAQLDLGVTLLRSAGIEVQPWRLNPSDLFSTPVLFGDFRVWQMMSFAWKASADPFLGDSMYRCVGEGPHGMGLLNVARYCDEEVDRLIEANRRVMDPVERAAVYNDADQRYLEDFAVIPLYQQPVLLAWTANLEGPTHNPWSTDLWNVGAWTGQSEIVVATDGDPASLTAPLPTDDAAAMIMGAIYRGAYRVDLSGEYEADLVTGVEVLLRGG